MSRFGRPNRRVLAAALLAVSVYPPMLPREPWVQAVESLVLVGLGWALGRPGPRTGTGPAVALAVVLGAGLGWQVMLWLRTGVVPVGFVPLAVMIVGGGVLLLVGAREPSLRVPWRVRARACVLTLALTAPLAVPGVSVPPVPVAVSSSVVSVAPVAPVQVEVSLDVAREPEARARAAVADLVRAGGLTRSVVVVAVPTGSGWVDEAALAALHDVSGGDVATVSVAYDDAPSWRSYLDGREEAVATTRAVLDGVREAVGVDRPVLVYGQSLGALVGASAARPGLVDGALWVGVPRGTPASPVPTTSIVHASDPAAVWSPALLWRPPSPGTVADLPRPPWVPGVSFLQTSVDLLGALSVPAGHGHRYGEAEHRAAWATLLGW